ncbi:MAG: MATE family efflux transporter [Dehalococcoidia bacterium]
MTQPAVLDAPEGVVAPSMTPTVLRLAWPVVVERLSVSVLSAVDAVLVGRYVGADGVAAVGIGALMFWVPFAGAFGLDIATTAVIARDFGAGETRNLERTMRMSLLIAVLWGFAATALLWPLAGPLLTLMAAEPEVKAFGIDYIRAASLGFPMLMLLYAASGVFRGLGNTMISMVIIIVLNIVNALVAFLLISGAIGIELEVLASGIGYACGGTVGGLLALVVLVSGFGPVTYRVNRAFVTGRAELKRLMNLGVPTGLEEVQFMLAFIVYSRVVTGLGTTAVAAHSIALRTLELALVPGFSLGAAATTLVSRYLGAQRPDLAERAANVGRLWAVGLMIAMGGLLALFAPQFVSIFVDDPEVVEVGTQLLRIFAIAFPFMGLHASLGGALRGAGDVRYVLGVLTVTAWLVRIPVAVFLGVVLGFGAPGAWVGATSENIVRGTLIWRRFRQGRWKEKVV